MIWKPSKKPTKIDQSSKDLMIPFQFTMDKKTLQIISWNQIVDCKISS